MAAMVSLHLPSPTCGVEYLSIREMVTYWQRLAALKRSLSQPIRYLLTHTSSWPRCTVRAATVPKARSPAKQRSLAYHHTARTLQVRTSRRQQSDQSGEANRIITF